ncbi:hypothetical protein H9P43_005995 [Blastocladiella emersonii ATCC 22665]|nr:hypothetical protein H9P43_005995 [Blastocladiella emersonii ATCC 22665]
MQAELFDHETDQLFATSAAEDEFGLEVDVALYSFFNEEHDDWSATEVEELLQSAYAMITAIMAYPEVCASVILPQLRSAFPLPIFAPYPRTLRLYERDHGDMGLMLRELRQIPLSPINDWQAFFSVVLDHYAGVDAAELAIFLNDPRAADLVRTYPLDPNPRIAQFKANALLQGSAPYHVRLAFETVRPLHRAPAALSLFRFAYENPMDAGFRFTMSARLNDFRAVDRPVAAMDKVAQLFSSYRSPSEPEPRDNGEEVADDPEFLSFVFNSLATPGALNFGFRDPDHYDSAQFGDEADPNEVAGDALLDDDMDEGNFALDHFALSALSGQAPGLPGFNAEAGPNSRQVVQQLALYHAARRHLRQGSSASADSAGKGEEDMSEWWTLAKGGLDAAAALESSEDGGDPAVDDDFLRLCLEQLEASNGNLEGVDLDTLVDALIDRDRT